MRGNGCSPWCDCPVCQPLAVGVNWEERMSDLVRAEARKKAEEREMNINSRLAEEDRLQGKDEGHPLDHGAFCECRVHYVYKAG